MVRTNSVPLFTRLQKDTKNQEMVIEIKELNVKHNHDNENSIDAKPILEILEETNNSTDPTNQASKAAPSTKHTRGPSTETRKSPRHKLLQEGSDSKKMPGSKGKAQSPDDKSVHTNDSEKVLKKPLRLDVPIPPIPNLSRASPDQERVTTRKSPPSIPTKGSSRTIKNKKEHFSKIKSLPFLGKDPKIAKILMEQESRAFSRKVSNSSGTKLVSSSPKGTPQEVNVFVWKAQEVINFFRGLYNYGWGNWSEISRMTETRSNMQAKTHAQKLEQRFPILRTYFSPSRVKSMHRKYGMVKRYTSGSEDGSSEDTPGASVVSVKSTRSSSKKPDLTSESTAATATKAMTISSAKRYLRVKTIPTGKDETSNINFLNVSEKNHDQKSTTSKQEVNTKPDDSALMAASVIKSLKSDAEPVKSPLSRFVGNPSSINAPKVTICLGNYKIDTGDSAENNGKRSADSFDPPKVPAIKNQKIFIPGIRVYARWLDEDDPDSYGAWYPGYLAAATAVTEDEGNTSDIPNLRYHIKFDDGVDVTNQRGEDIMMHEEYRSWIKSLEDYHALSVTRSMVSKRLTKGTKVFAKFIDESDPELHGQWFAGTIISAKVSNSISQLRYSYHVLFFNGDEDEDLSDVHVLDEDSYYSLAEERNEERNENRNKRNRTSSGLDFLCGAAHITSMIKTKAAEIDSLRPQECDAAKSASEAMDVETNTADESHLMSVPPSMAISPIADVSSNSVLQNAHGGSINKPQLKSDLMCYEVLASRTRNPADECRDPDAPSHHYGCYFVTKTVKVPQYYVSKKNPTIRPSSVTHQISPTVDTCVSSGNRQLTKHPVTPSSHMPSSTSKPKVVVENTRNSIELDVESYKKAVTSETRDPTRTLEKSLSTDPEVVNPTQCESRDRTTPNETHNKNPKPQLPLTSNESLEKVSVAITHPNKKHEVQ